MQVDRQREYLTARGCFHTVFIRYESLEAIDIVPDFLVIGVENMGSVNVDHHAGIRIAFGVAVAAHMIAAVDDCDIVTGLGELATNNGAGQSGTNKNNFHKMISKILSYLSQQSENCKNGLESLGV